MNLQQSYDAKVSAQPSENTFTLQGQDPYAPTIINLWATLMIGDVTLLDDAYDSVRQALKNQVTLGNSFGMVQMEKGKHTEAYQIAMHLRSGDIQASKNISYNAHKTAKKDELTFTLQSSDPYCADLTELWAALITGNENETDMRFQQLTKTLTQQLKLGNLFGKTQRKRGKIEMAFKLSKDMTQGSYTRT